MTAEHQEQPTQPQDASVNTEHEARLQAIKDKVTSTRGRIAAGTFHELLMDPQNKLKADKAAELKEALTRSKAKDINYDAVNAISKEDGIEHWATREGTLGEQNVQWDNGFSEYLKRETTTANKEEDKDFIEITEGLGIKSGENHSDPEKMQSIIDFREKYFPGGERDIGKFVSDLADTCTDNQDNVDLDKMEQKLDLLENKGFMNVFGKTDTKALVIDHAMTHGLFSQEEGDVKNAGIDATVDQARQYPSEGPEKDRQRKLYNKHRALNPLNFEPQQIKLDTAASADSEEQDQPAPVPTGEANDTTKKPEEPEPAPEAEKEVGQRYGFMSPSGEKQGEVIADWGNQVKIKFDNGEIYDTTKNRLEDPAFFRKLTNVSSETTTSDQSAPPQQA